MRITYPLRKLSDSPVQPSGYRNAKRPRKTANPPEVRHGRMFLSEEKTRPPDSPTMAARVLQCVEVMVFGLGVRFKMQPKASMLQPQAKVDVLIRSVGELLVEAVFKKKGPFCGQIRRVEVVVRQQLSRP